MRIHKLALLALAALLLVGTPLTDGFGLDVPTPGCGLRQLLLFGAGLGLAWLAGSPRVLGSACRTRELVALAFGLGLLLAAVDVVHQSARRFGWGVVVRRPELVAWMAPLLDVAVFVSIALACAAAGRRWPNAATRPFLVFVLVLTGAWSQLLPHPWIHDAAVLLLATGLATAAARLAARADARERRAPARAPALGAAAAVLALGGVFLAGRPPAPAAVSPPPPARAPDVLLVVLDTVRADHLGFHGYERDTTPVLDDLAARGIVFERAIATAPFTLTSHVSMLTGRYPFETRADRSHPLEDRHPTLAEVLSAQGYACAGFVGNVPYCSRAWGLARGFEHYEDYPLALRTVLLSTPLGIGLAFAIAPGHLGQLWRNDARHVSARFLAWLDRRATDDRPFFAFLNYFDAHGLYLCPEPWQSRFGPPGDAVHDMYLRGDWSPAENRSLVDAYDGCLRHLDHRLGEMLGELERRGALENTWLVITSDHGEQFGEHGLWEHSNSLYMQLLHVPLLVVPPGGTEPRRVPGAVSLADLPATVLDLAHLERSPLPGASLAPRWRTPPPWPAASPAISVHRDVSLVLDGMHFIASSGEVYDVDTDPEELHDLSDTPLGAAFARRAFRIGLEVNARRHADLAGSNEK